MSDWTAERLDALPEGALIESAELSGWWVRDRDDWLLVGEDDCVSSSELLPLSGVGSIRVVSVPLDALLSPKPATPELGRIDPTSEGALMVIRAAIAHATGGQP